MRDRQPAQQCIEQTDSLHSPHGSAQGGFARWLRDHVRWMTLLALVLSGILAPISQGASVFFFPAASAHALVGTQSTPNRFDPRTASQSARQPQQSSSSTNSSAPSLPAKTPVPIRHTPDLPMTAATVALQAGKAATFLGSDGKLEVDVPANAVSAANIASSGGSLNLKITQIAPASGSSAGGSGRISFGTYLLQVVDGKGNRVAQSLSAPVTMKYHPDNAGRSALDLTNVIAVLNGAVPTNLQLAPLASGVSGATTTSTSPALGPVSSQKATLDKTDGSLVVTASLPTPSTTLTWNTYSPVATFGSPDPFNVDLNAGALTSGLPIDLPAGPGGFTPPVSLSYSSAGVNEQHNPQGAADWVGEGWNLSLGAITWAEHNTVPPSCTTCGNGWESNWEISDPYGTGTELIPPNISVNTFWDDTPNWYCTLVNGVCQSYPNVPVTWHTANETYAKIVSYVGPLNINQAATPPCFRVWLTNGVMEEFGCTLDSLEYYYEPGNGKHLYAWNLDLIVDPSGNQIHLNYQQDLETFSSVQYVRSAELSTIEYDSPTCLNTSTACTTAGAAPNKWAPLMRVNFVATHTPAHLTNSPAGCNTSTNARCDNPKDLSGTSGLTAPQVMNTFALNDIQAQVRGSGTASWNTLRDYQLSYEQSGPGTITDPSTGKQESAAGMFDLTQIKEIGDDASTALPTRAFTYGSVDQSYVDSGYSPAAGVGCGFSWNTGNGGSGCLLWSQTVAGNDRYMTSASNGMGLAQSFTWVNARNNMHGVVGGGANTANPLYCNDPSRQSTYPCNEADDETWSRVVLAQDSEQVLRLTQNGQGGAQTSTPVTGTSSYAYTLAYPLVAQECADCVAGMYWGNQNEGDYLDYYNGKFMGFTQTKVTHPDGSVDVHKYEVTDGWGIYDTAQIACKSGSPCHNAPWWHIGNAGHGHETEVDSYDIGGSTLLSQTTTSYNLVCPPSGVTATPAVSGFGNWDSMRVSELDHGNPVAVCDVQTAQVDTYTWDGATSGAVPHSTTTYTYDSYGRVTATTTTSNDGGATGSPTTIVQKTDYIWDDAVTATLTSATGKYLISFPALVRTEDSGGTTRASCAYTSYDSGAYATGQQSSLARGLVTTADTYTACGTSPSFTPSGKIEVTTTYDAFGNEITTNDPDANAGNTAHKGCTVGSSTYSSCIAYDATFSALPISSKNALNQSATLGYGTTTDATGGFGLWPTSATDPNSQVAKTTYDPLGRTLSATLPGEGAGLTTTNTSYTFWCSGTAAQSPCIEVDNTQRLNSSNTVTSRSFYDGLGRLVETRAPAAGGHDTVQYAYYDPSGREVFQSVPYLVTPYTGAPGVAAYSIPDSTQLGTSLLPYTSLLSMTSSDPLSHSSTSAVSIVCNASGTGDSACYAQSASSDALNHKSTSLTDALGRAMYAQSYTGNSGGTYAVYATVKNTYDLNGNLTKITQPNGSATIYTYDAAGRTTGMTDPDRGSETYSYDSNGNVIETVDARGPGGGGGGPTTLMGDTSVEPTQDAVVAGQAVAFRYVATSTGTANTAYVYVDAGNLSPTIKVGLYADNGSNLPGTLLTQATITSPTNGAWNSVTLPGSPAVTSGTTYWISVLGPASGNDLYFRDNDLGGSDMVVYSSSTALNTLPSSWTNGGSSPGVRASAYVVQSGGSGGSGGVIYAGYDGLNRQLWRNTTNSPTGAYTTYSYDSISGGNRGIGRLTGETFSSLGGALGSGSYSYTYDVRGQTTNTILTVGANSYPLATSYNDAGQALILTYPTGETVTAGYSAQGWLGSLSRTLSGTTTSLLDTITYTGTGGAAGQMTGAHLGNGTYTYSANYDALARPTDVKTQRASDNATLFEEAPSYDAVGNITGETLTLPTGTDVQRFCYDEQNRLTWAGSVGTPPCTGTAITPGSLTAAQYTQSFSYDTLNRLTSGPLGSYTYGDSAHLHAATQVGSGGSVYTAAYDASGNMVCRAPTGSTTCAGGSLTGAQLTWDNEGRLTGWQNAPTAPTSTAQYLYDGEGHRVQQQVTTGGTTTTTTYIGALEQIAVTGGTTTTTTYYYAAGQRIALAVNGTLSYLASDLLGSASVALNASGIATASQLYAPYGGVRYSNGTMPTDYGFTGQRTDAATGLDDYGARYYDPAIGQFTSADTVLDGLNRYGYVDGNPITWVDPSGHIIVEFDPTQFGGRPPGPGGPLDGGQVNDGTGGGPPIPSPVSERVANNGCHRELDCGINVVRADGSIGYISTTGIPYDPDLSEVYNRRTVPQMLPVKVAYATQLTSGGPNGGDGGGHDGGGHGGGGHGGGGHGGGGHGGGGTPDFNDGAEFNYRGDTRPPSDIFQNGFQPRGTNTDLNAYLNGAIDTVYVGTSRKFGIADIEHAVTGDFVYTVRVQNGIDINTVMGPGYQYAFEEEVAAVGGIQVEDVFGAREKLGTGVFGPFLPNPAFVP